MRIEITLVWFYYGYYCYYWDSILTLKIIQNLIGESWILTLRTLHLKYLISYTYLGSISVCFICRCFFFVFFLILKQNWCVLIFHMHSFRWDGNPAIAMHQHLNALYIFEFVHFWENMFSIRYIAQQAVVFRCIELKDFFWLNKKILFFC